MIERENIIRELWKRLAGVSGVNYTARTPAAPPSAIDLPAIQFFELSDSVTDATRRGNYVANKRKLTVVVETAITATTEASATNELIAFMDLIKAAIFDGDQTLGKKCLIQEEETSQIFRPTIGENAIGVAMVFSIHYVEDVNNLFNN